MKAQAYDPISREQRLLERYYSADARYKRTQSERDYQAVLRAEAEYKQARRDNEQAIVRTR